MKTAERYTKHLEQMCGPLNERTKYAAVMLFREALNEPAAELEAQHRKTWALAIEAAAAKLVWCNFNGQGLCDETSRQAVADLPCSPIEATKDK